MPWRRALGLYDMRQFTNLQGLTAAGVGGGSLIWANVVVEAPAAAFARGWPDGVTPENLRPYYARAREFLRPAYAPGVSSVTAEGKRILRAELHQTAAKLTGRRWEPLELAVDFNDGANRANGFGKALQSGCNSCGMCSAGCPRGAKNTTNLTSLASAEAAGARVLPLHEVTAIEPLARGYKVHFNRYRLDGRVAERGWMLTRQVVLSAGSFATTELLLRNKRNGNLPRLSRALGSKFSINGNVVSGALMRGRATTGDTNDGPAITSLIDFGDHAVEDIANPLAVTAGILGTSHLGRIVAYIKARLGLADSPAQLAATMQDLLVYVGVGRDRARGKLSLNLAGNLHLTWPGGLRNEPVIQALHCSMRQIAEALGREYVPDVLSTFGRMVTYHPLGGAPMGEAPDTGVADSFGRVFNYPGLFIADGSIVPSALGRNPSFTIAALSERIAERMS